jgi:cytochrome oxidase Cu insertion factor (SCO1/SenC/PrrC family)
MPDREFRMESKLVSADYLDLQVEKLSLLALIDQVSYLDLIDARFDGELADRLKASFLTRNLRRYPEPEKMIGQYLKEMKSEPWKERIRTLGESTIPGSSLIALELEDTEGNILTSEVLKDNLTLLYFYFSTCVHSAHYFQDMLWPMYQDLAKEKGVQLIAVSVDKDRSLWLNNIPKYSNPQISNYRLTEKSKQEFVQFYEVSGYPRTFLIDSNREIVAFGLDRSAYSKFEEDFLKHLSKLSETTSTPNPPTP